MIKSLTPFYITIPFVSPFTAVVCTSYTLNIYVWDGDRDLIIAEPSYSMTKKNPTASVASDKINIARLVNDFIDFDPPIGVATSLIDGVNQRWCRTNVVYKTVAPADLDMYQLEIVQLITRGYGYGMEGENPTIPANRILMTGTEFKANRSGSFIVPIKILEPALPILYFATITGLITGCIHWVYNEPYLEAVITVQSSINGGASWTNNTGGPVSPRCGFSPVVTTMYRLKQQSFNIYSNVLTIVI